MNYQEPTSPRPTTLSQPDSALKPRSTRRVALITAAAVVLMLAAFWGFDAFRASMMKSFFANNKPPPLAVNTEVVQTSTLPQFLTAIGSVAAVNQVVISAEVAGRVTKLVFEGGAEVKKGDLLVQLNDAPEQADLAAARAQQRLAKVALDRARELQTSGFVAKARLDEAQSQFDSASAEIARVEARIAQKQIRAPFDGVLGVRQIELGQNLDPGDPIVILTDTTRLHVEFTVPEQVRPQLALRQMLELTVDAYPGRTFRGMIFVLDPQVNTEARTIKLQAGIDNSERLLMPGMFANVRIALPPREGVLTVAETALDHTIYGDSVYLVRSGDAGPDGKPTLTVVRTPVEAGERANGRVAVTGLKAGDRVVTAGQVKLFEGAAVTLDAQPVLKAPDQVPVE